MSTKAKTPPINRLTQTLRTIRYARAHKQPPLAKWEVILTLANSTHSNGEPKAMSADELAYEMGTTVHGVPTALLLKDGYLCSEKIGALHTYLLSLKGQDEAARIINGVITTVQASDLQPDMEKVNKYVGAIPKYT